MTGVTRKDDALFQARLARHIDELRWLYMELYGNGAMFAELYDNLYRFAQERSAALKKRDKMRETNPEWYRSNVLRVVINLGFITGELLIAISGNTGICCDPSLCKDYSASFQKMKSSLIQCPDRGDASPVFRGCNRWIVSKWRLR